MTTLSPLGEQKSFLNGESGGNYAWNPKMTNQSLQKIFDLLSWLKYSERYGSDLLYLRLTKSGRNMIYSTQLNMAFDLIVEQIQHFYSYNPTSSNHTSLTRLCSYPHGILVRHLTPLAKTHYDLVGYVLVYYLKLQTSLSSSMKADTQSFKLLTYKINGTNVNTMLLHR